MRRHRTVATLGVVVLLCLIWIDVRVITGEVNTKDAAGYERIAVDLARTGVFAQAGAPTRTAEPLHIAVLALQVRLDPRLAETRETGVVAAGPPSRAVKQQNLLWSAVLLSGVAAQVLTLRRGRRDAYVLAIAAMVAVTLLLLENPDVVDRSLAELPAAALLVWAGVGATQLVRRRTVAPAAAVGVLLGLLVLTRAVFLYVALPYVGFLLLLVARDRRGDGASLLARIGPLLLAGLLTFAAAVGPWALRNHLAFGDPALTERGGEILHLRAVKNGMDGYQHRGAWVYWAPLPLQGPLAGVLRVDRGDFGSGRPLAAIARYDDEVDALGESFYRGAKNEIRVRRAELIASGLSDAQAREQSEGEFGARALNELRQRPQTFLRTTPVFLWRLLWPMNSSLTVPRPLLAVINLAGMAALVAAATVGLARRPELFAVAGLPAGTAAFYSLVTHAIPRYARPLAPTMVILLVLIAAALLERARRPAEAVR